MRLYFMDTDGKNLGIDNFIVKGKVDGEYGIYEEEVELNFKNKSTEEIFWYNREFLIIRAEKLSKSEYKIKFLKEDIEGRQIEVEYEDELEIEIKCCKCGRNMKHLITKYPLSDFLINCYTERFYNCLKIDNGCGYEVIIGLDEC